jgi:hypothetical protein
MYSYQWTIKIVEKSNCDGSVKSPTSAFREARKGLKVLNVRLGLSKLARLEFFSFLRSHPSNLLQASKQSDNII